MKPKSMLGDFSECIKQFEITPAKVIAIGMLRVLAIESLQDTISKPLNYYPGYEISGYEILCNAEKFLTSPSNVCSNETVRNWWIKTYGEDPNRIDNSNIVAA